MADSLSDPSPQFGTAEYIGKPGNDHCQFCYQPLAGNYYRINKSIACSRCAEKMRGTLATDSHAAFTRALLYGIGAAILGMILYAVFEIATGLIVGYVSLAVGWMVGTAMMKGSHGVGGRRYQIVAVLLTYAAVSMAAAPVWIHYGNKHRREQQAADSAAANSRATDSTTIRRGTAAVRNRIRPEAFPACSQTSTTEDELRCLAGSSSAHWISVSVPRSFRRRGYVRLANRCGDTLRGHEDRRQTHGGTGA